MWRATDVLDLFRFVPLVVNSLRHHPQRLMFVRILLWAMPDRGSQIGTMLALGVDSVMFQRISDDIPDVIPRGMNGWHKFG